MAGFVPWSSQPIEEWSKKYAAGKFVDLDGHRTHYIEKGEGEPVILLHGFFFDSCLWNKSLDALAARFKVYALDFWGFGYSTREPMDCGYPLYADQVLKFMDALNIRAASLVGQSFGGGTCISFCVRHRDRVRKLLLVDPAGMPLNMPLLGKIMNLAGIGEFLLGLNGDFLRKMTLTTLLYDKSLITRDYLDNVTRHQKIKGSNEASLNFLRKQFVFALLDDIRKLGEMGVPTLIVWGRNDKSVPVERGQEMHRILKGSRLVVLERAGHCPNEEHWQQFNQLAIDFLSSS